MASGGGGYTPKESEAEKEASRIAIEKWNDYLRRYTPAEDALQQRIDQMSSDAYQRELAAQAASQAMAGTKQLYQTGANINNRAQRAQLGAAVRGMAKAAGYGTSAAPLAAQTRKWDAQYAYAQAGQGISGEGLGRLSQLGTIQNSYNINQAKIEADAANSRLMTLGSLGAAGLMAYGQYEQNQEKQRRYDAFMKQYGGS